MITMLFGLGVRTRKSATSRIGNSHFFYFLNHVPSAKLINYTSEFMILLNTNETLEFPLFVLSKCRPANTNRGGIRFELIVASSDRFLRD